MADERYEAGRKTIGELLATTSPPIVVPAWQRSYSWEGTQTEAFWRDLLAFSERYPDDTIKGQEYFLGSIVLVTGTDTQELLDGQQRLATATILISVIRDACATFNSDTATRQQNRYISDIDDAAGEETFQLTLNKYDAEFFRREVQQRITGSGQAPQPKLKSHMRMRKARAYLKEELDEQWKAEANEEAGFKRALRIADVLLNRMSVVAVTSSDQDNASAVFETLNDRGIGLSTPDLLRNLLIRRAGDDEKRHRIVNAWEAILAAEDEASSEDFIRHYWVSRRGDVKGRKLYREIKDTVEAEELDALELSTALSDTADIYRDIVAARDSDDETRRLLDGVRLLGAKVLYPAILSAFQHTEDDHKELQALLRALTTVFVRSAVLGGRQAGTIETEAYETASALFETGDFDAAISRLDSFSPDAEDARDRFRTARIERRATQRYLLRQIEHAKRASGELAVETPDRVHVEHIYPQKPEEGHRWDNHSAMLNRIGNVTLLAKRLNVQIKNAVFDKKKSEVYSESDLLLTKELMEYTEWNPAQIQARQDELSDWIFQAWSFDGEAAPEPLDAESPPAGSEDDDSEASLPAVPDPNEPENQGEASSAPSEGA